ISRSMAESRRRSRRKRRGQAPMSLSRVPPCSKARPQNPIGPISLQFATRRPRCGVKQRDYSALHASTDGGDLVAETRFRIWFEIEAHAADAMAELGMIPKDAAKTIWEKGKAARFDVARIEAIEREVKHDVVAFLTHLAEIVGPQARFVHQGMT